MGHVADPPTKIIPGAIQTVNYAHPVEVVDLMATDPRMIVLDSQYGMHFVDPKDRRP